MKAPAQVAIQRAGPEDAPAVMDLLATALRGTDIARWLVPDWAERARIYHDYFALVAPWYLEHGTVNITEDGAGVAVWATCQGRFEPDIVEYDVRLAAACGAATDRFIGLDAAMLVQHPDVTHAYLAFLAVDPDARNTGVGSALLTHQHTRLDANGVPAYLEATGSRNAALYARHGYTSRTPYPIGIGGPPLRPMWREPMPTRLPAACHRPSPGSVHAPVSDTPSVSTCQRLP
jgi:GNAT superfamily N-acetyltransferase